MGAAAHLDLSRSPDFGRRFAEMDRAPIFRSALDRARSGRDCDLSLCFARRRFPAQPLGVLAWHHRVSFVARQYLRFDAVSSAENYFLRHHLRSALQFSASAADFCYCECF